MKKFISMIVLACMTTAMQAQETETSSCTKSCCSATCNKYSVLTNSFWSNWFVSANVGYNMFYSNEEKGLNDKPGLFDGSRSTIGLSVAVGKWFTPGIGLRTRLSGFWGREVKPDALGSLKNTDNNSYEYSTTTGTCRSRCSSISTTSSLVTRRTVCGTPSPISASVSAVTCPPTRLPTATASVC